MVNGGGPGSKGPYTPHEKAYCPYCYRLITVKNSDGRMWSHKPDPAQSKNDPDCPGTQMRPLDALPDGPSPYEQRLAREAIGIPAEQPSADPAKIYTQEDLDTALEMLAEDTEKLIRDVTGERDALRKELENSKSAYDRLLKTHNDLKEASKAHPSANVLQEQNTQMRETLAKLVEDNKRLTEALAEGLQESAEPVVGIPYAELPRILAAERERVVREVTERLRTL